MPDRKPRPAVDCYPLHVSLQVISGDACGELQCDCGDKPTQNSFCVPLRGRPFAVRTHHGNIGKRRHALIYLKNAILLIVEDLPRIVGRYWERHVAECKFKVAANTVFSSL